MLLDTNMRNTQAIGELAARFGQCSLPQIFRIAGGEPPVTLISPNFADMAVRLRQLLRRLQSTELLALDQIVVLSPYRYTNAQSDWSRGLADCQVTTDMVAPAAGQLRVGFAEISSTLAAQASGSQDWSASCRPKKRYRRENQPWRAGKALLIAEFPVLSRFVFSSSSRLLNKGYRLNFYKFRVMIRWSSRYTAAIHSRRCINGSID